MNFKTKATRAGVVALLTCSVLLTGCYDGRPGHNSDRHHDRDHHGDHHDGDHHDGDHHD